MSIAALIDRAYAELYAENYPAALKTAAKLIAKKSPEGHAIKVSTLIALQEPDAAVDAALHAVALFPGRFAVQNALGMALLNARRPDEAETALISAGECDDVEPIEHSLALATLYSLEEKWDKVLEVLAGNEEWSDADGVRVGLQLTALHEAGLWEDALAFTQGLADELGEDLAEHFGDETAAMLLAVRARAILEVKKQPRRAANGAWEALRIYPDEDIALEVIRRCGGRPGLHAKCFALDCELATPGEDPFFCGYVVQAGTLDEAFDYVSAFEAQVSGAEARLVAHEELPPEPEEFCGVLEVIDIEDEMDDGAGAAE